MTGGGGSSSLAGDKQMVILRQFVLLVKLQLILSSDLCSHQPSGGDHAHFNKYTYFWQP